MQLHTCLPPNHPLTLKWGFSGPTTQCDPKSRKNITYMIASVARTYYIIFDQWSVLDVSIDFVQVDRQVSWHLADCFMLISSPLSQLRSFALIFAGGDGDRIPFSPPQIARVLGNSARSTTWISASASREGGHCFALLSEALKKCLFFLPTVYYLQKGAMNPIYCCPACCDLNKFH